MDLFAIEKKEYRWFDIITMAIDPVMTAAAGEENDLEILFMLMGWSDQCAFSKRLDLYMLFGADLVFGWNAFFQW